MSFFTSILKDKKDDGADGKTTTAPSTSNQYNGQTDYTSATITTTSGKQYTLDRKTIDWIQTRYRNDGIDSYGFDDADQQAKRTGQMSAAMRSTYTDSNVDQQLMQMGLPSEKYLEKYLDGYGKWHTGGITDVYGDAVPADFWTKTKDWYKNDWVYEDTPEDQQRKAKGLMPTALASKYTDTELDDDLMARGLPSYANMKTYAQRYDNYKGIDAFYANAAGAWTNLRLRGIKNDDGMYTDKETGETKTGTQWYADAFYDTLEAVGDDGQRTYGGIIPLFRNNHATASEIDEDKDYITERGKAIAATSKAIDAENDYAKYDAFSYDDFAGKYDEYYARYFADQELPLANGGTIKVTDYLVALDQQEAKEKEAAYYTVDHPATKDVDDSTSVESFIERYQKDFPDRDYGQMFQDMKDHGVDDGIIKETKRQLRKGVPTREQRNVIDKAYDEFMANSRAAEEEARPVSQSMLDLLNTDMNTLASGIESYIQAYGGFTPENVQKALHHYKDIGVTELNIDRAKALVKERYAETGTPGEQMGEIMMSFDWNYDYKSQSKVNRNKELAADASGYMQSRRETIAPDDSVDKAAREIKYAVHMIGEGITPDALFDLTKSIAGQNWANATVARRALIDLGFSEDGDFTGSAATWTTGWTGTQKSAFLSQLKRELHTLDDVENKHDMSVSGGFNGEGAGRFFGEGADEKNANIMMKDRMGGLSQMEDKVIDVFTKGDGIPLDIGEFEILREWMDEKLANGDATPMELYNALCSMGYQDELEAYDADRFHEAIFKEQTVPAMFEQAAGSERAFWEEASPEERQQIADDIWNSMSATEQQSMFQNYDWKLDPNIYRTTGQTWGQQFLAVVPSVVTSVASGAVGFADMVATVKSELDHFDNSDRPVKDDLWDVTKELVNANAEVSSFGNVSDNVNGAALARIASDATSELIKMYALGSIGGVAGEAFGNATGLASVAAGSVESAAVQKIAGFAIDFIKASPFVFNAVGNGFEEAKLMGAKNGEATAYALVTGTLEGVLEGLNFDKVWGSVLGQGSFGKMLIDGGNIWKNAGVVAKARVINMLVAGLGEATEETASYLAETLWKTHSSWGGDTEWSADDWVEQAGMGFLTGLIGAGIGSGSINEASIMQDYYENLGVIKGAIIDHAIAEKYWNNATDAQREAWRNGTVKVLSMPEFANMMMQVDNCYRADAAADEAYQQTVEKWDAKVSSLSAEIESVKSQIAPLNPYDAEDAAKLAKLHTQLRGLQTQMDVLQDQRTVAIQKAADDRDTRKDNAASQLSDLQAKYAEHYAALYLRNESAANAGDYDAINTNHARARQNGDTVDLTAEAEEATFNAESEADSRIERPDRVAVEGQTGQPANTLTGTTDAAARQTGARVLTDDEIGQINDIANRVGFRYGIDFINDPDNVGDAWFDKTTGRITINQANITAAEAEDLVSNPGFWLLRHEWSHYIEGSKYYSEYLDTVSRLQMNELGTGGYNAAIQHIIQERAQKGISLGETAEEQRQNARMELAAKYAQGRLFTSQESIDAFVREQKGVAVRLYNWLQYVIDRGKLRRQKNSAEARAILEAERMYAKAFRKANINPASIGTEESGDFSATSEQSSGSSVDTTPDSGSRRFASGLSYDDFVAEFGKAGDYVGVANPDTGVTAEEDEAYMRAAMSGDTETAKRMVRDLYERNGWTHTYRGEPEATGSWTQVDMDKFKAVGMFSSPDLSTAQAPEYTQSYAKEDLKTKPLSYGDEMPVLQAFADGVAKRVGKGLSLVAESYYMDDEGNTFTEPGQGREHHWALRDARTGDIFADSTELTTLADATKRKAARLVGGNPQNVYNSISDPFAGRILDLFVRFDHVNEYNARGDEWDKIRLNGPKGVTLYRIEVTPDADAGNTFTVTAYPIDESFDAESSSASERAVKSAAFTSEDDFDYAYNLENAFRDLFGPKSDVIEFFEENAEWDGEGGAVLDKVGVRDKNGRYVAPELFPEAETTSTDALAARDKAAGYDGTIIRNVRDGGPSKATDYVSFNPNYIKSADAITYDDNGNIIPLSQRGDTSRNNLRYSTGTSYDDLLQQYGAKDQGMDPRARDIQVPERVSNERRLSDFIRSLLESGKVTEDQVREIEDLIVNEDWGSYIPTKDEKRMERARAYIAMRQPLQAQQEFHDMVTRGKYGADTNALGLQLLADAAQRGDTDSVLQISADLQVLATEAGQSVQIFSVLKRLGGVGSAVYMQKVIDRFNSEYADRIQAGKMQPITVDPALMQQLASAKTTKQIAAAEEAVAKAIGAQLPLTFTDRASAWRYFAMLANPTTHFRNITGNVLMAGLNTAKDAVATGLENVLGVKQDDRAHAILTAKDRSTWGRFAQSSFEDQQRNLQGGGKLGFETFVKQNMRSFDTSWLNALAKFNFNALEGEDLVFIRPAYKNALMEYMKAQGYTLNAKGEAGKVNAKGEFTAITQAQMNAAVEWASNQAWKATFRDASSLATMLNKISKQNAVSRLLVEGVMPFKKTPINIAKRGIEYSPAGIIMGTVQLLNGVKKGKVTTAEAIDNLASGITGTALMAVGMFLAKAGVIRAGGEDKKKYETYLEDTGDQTYSLKFGDASINLSAIAPATIPLFMGVALMEALDRNDGGSFDFSTFTDTMAGTLNPFMEMSFMSSLNSALQNYNNNGIGGALGNTLLTAAENYGSQYLPTVTSKLGQFIDPVRRTTKSDATSQLGSNMDYYVKSLFKKVPGLEATLQPDVDVWGRTDVKDSFGDYLLDFANKFILPTTVKIANRDVVDDELIRLVESTGSVDFLPSDGNKYFTVGGQKFTMNANQYTEFSQERGQASYAALKETMRSAAYQRATDEEKAAMLEKALKAAQKQVNTKWKEKLGALD